MPSGPGPHVHLDNRSLFLSDGARTVMFSLSQTRWLAETLDIIAADGRASRDQQHHVFGGFRADSGAVVLYAGAQEELVAVRVTGEAFEQLRSTLSPRADLSLAATAAPTFCRKPSTRRHASSHASACSLNERSKNECGAPG